MNQTLLALSDLRQTENATWVVGKRAPRNQRTQRESLSLANFKKAVPFCFFFAIFAFFCGYFFSLSLRASGCIWKLRQEKVLSQSSRLLVAVIDS